METKRLTFTDPCTGTQWGYLLSLPADMDGKGGEPYPLVLFLHGIGEGGNGTTELDLVAAHSYGKYIAAGKEYPFIFASPQLTRGKFWVSYIETLNRFLDHLLETLPVDRDRVYLTGLSCGGTGTWIWGEANPERFAALLPVCGAGIVWSSYTLCNTPIWAFHGDADGSILCTESQNMVNAINARGGNAKLTLYPGVGHNSWDYAYTDDKVVEWMLSQRRQSFDPV